MLFNPIEHTTVFLSYDEPNCEENYQHLLTLNPNSLRVHGVKGSDKAHKECAKLSQTNNIIIVDGDNFVKPDFYTTIELPDTISLSNSILSYSGNNSINGTQYGNGGIKVWPTNVISNMKTHEASEGKHQVDFDYHSYIELNTVGSDVHIHITPLQAFRAGFREGVKLCLEDDLPASWDRMDKYNFDRLWMWMHVGMDMNNGLYAIYGARLGAYLTLYENFDYLQIRDFDYLNNLFNSIDLSDMDNLGNKLAHPLITNVLTIEDSKRIRDNYINPNRSKYPMYQSSDFIEWAESYREAVKTSDENTLNKMCSIGSSEPFGISKMLGARAGRNFNESSDRLYDYLWLKENYDRLH